jgi:amino acid transporter
MIRGVGLRSAVAINVATMVGAGPFITLPLVVTALHGSVSAIAWVLGALIALCDGLVWAELAARYPRSGGTYTYLREAFGPRGPGRFVAFLFVWQFLFWAPLILASGYIGFAQYAAYLVPALGGAVPTHLLAAATGVVVLLSLYRTIPQVASTALVLGAIALATLLAVAFAGLTHPYAPIAHTVSSTLTFGAGVVALGGALVNTLYDYSGYGDVCALGDEVIAPARTIPRAVVLSVLFVGAAYVLLNLGVASAVAPKEIMASNAIASLVAQRAFGAPFAVAVTLAVMVTAFASTYGLLLGASRIPYAAALEGDFLPQFARLHRSGRFPAVSLVTIGLLALPASLLSLDLVINALTAGIVLVQGAGQIVALGLARRAAPDAPFRVPLYPLPPLVALAGWLFLFWSTGAVAIGFGLATLAAGAIVFLVRARIGRIWPFAAATSAAFLALATACALPATPAFAQTPPASGLAQPAPTFGHAVLVRDGGGEQHLRVDGKPFFFLGSAFFYERIPRSQWRDAMLVMRGMGANTLDLYVPWNWHELADGDFDFDGRTSPRRDLREVLRLGKELGFFFIVRPGPVIRNEWRNGGYPAWLLRRPEYAMPLHDVLEGRYPATATLQNQHGDDAAAEWLANPTHVRYASRWLRRALEEFRPVADRVLAVQLDDDQAAYLDNDTYPGPHLHAYLGWLEQQVRAVAGPLTPVFVNTYETKVPSALPVWAMGNWYQSDAYAIGEHDRATLAFATAALRTQTAGPLAISEFQAGWLAGPESPTPREADPSNTALAIGELAGWGIEGLIVFPLQDTLSPFGWEAPFANAFYAWDAALRDDGSRSARYYPTSRLMRQLALYGPALAEAHRVAEVAVPYDGRTNAFGASASVTSVLTACRTAGIACDAIDPVTVSDARLRTFRYVVLADAAYPELARRAARLHVAAIGSVDAARGIPRAPDATLLRGPHGTFVVLENWDERDRRFDLSALSQRAGELGSVTLGGRDARILPVDVDLAFLSPAYRRGDRLSTSCAIPSFSRNDDVALSAYADDRPQVTFGPRPPRPCTVSASVAGRRITATLDADHALHLQAGASPTGEHVVVLTRHVFPGLVLGHPETTARFGAPDLDFSAPAGARAYRRDVFEDGGSEVVLQNARVLAIVAPDGGARVVAFGSTEYGNPLDAQATILNMFNATGGLRDDVLVQPPPSPTDRIAAFTHQYPAGMFDRPYAACTFGDARASGAYLSYDAPDVVPNGARFERVVTLSRDADRLVADERFTPAGRAPQQRLVSLSALEPHGSTDVLIAGPASTPVNRAATIDPRFGGFVLQAASAARAWNVSVAWRPQDVESASWVPAKDNGTLRLVFAPGGWRRVTFAMLEGVPDAVRRAAEAERAWVAANPAPASEDGEVAKRYTQSPQKRPSESSCGFESHLPHD